MKQRLLYINLDGFGRYYYDLIQDKTNSLPSITRLLSLGTFFANARTGIPSITFPMQSSIVSGCYSRGTQNCFAYLDRATRRMKTFGRHNRAQTIGELFAQQGLTTLSIQQFALEDRGCTRDDPQHLYIQPGGDCHKRFPLLLELLENNTLTVDGNCWRYDQLPDAIFLYLDDLDSIGHNPPFCYAETEEKRVANVQSRLTQIDQYIGQMLDIMARRGLLDHTYLLLTTDHGMVSYRGSRMTELKKAVEDFGFDKVEIHADTVQLDELPEVLLTGHSIQCQLYFGRTCANQEAMKDYLTKLPYVDKVLTSIELASLGVAPDYADMVISPIEGESFNVGMLEISELHASHDSLHTKCQQIFAMMSGPQIKRGYTEMAQVNNIDFLPGILSLMRLPPLADATGSLPGDMYDSIIKLNKE